jgi:hypothetical protein
MNYHLSIVRSKSVANDELEVMFGEDSVIGSNFSLSALLMCGTKLRFGITLFFWSFLAHASAISTVYYPAPESDTDNRGEHEVRLLRLALQKAGGRYEVKRATQRMQQERQLREIASGHGRLHVMATMTSKEREEILLPIRIPLDKGLIGWRLALLKAGRLEVLRNVKTLTDLKVFRVGQGREWPDTDVLRVNGLLVDGVTSYASLFKMLAADRFDYFPRSIKEIWTELADHPDLAVDPYVVIRYPAAEYFFVNRNNLGLAEAIRIGLEASIADGSFDKLFYEKFLKSIQQARLSQRVVIELSNPFLSSATPLGRKELWFHIEDLNHEGKPSDGRPHR